MVIESALPSPEKVSSLHLKTCNGLPEIVALKAVLILLRTHLP